MAAWTQSHFLQALGWATLNSFWQMALLWAVYAGVNHTINLSANRKYQSSVGAILLGFVWFVSTFFFYYVNSSSTYAIFENGIVQSNSLLPVLLVSASVTYILLLAFPAFRLFKNWQFVQLIKKDGHRKASLDYRLFVQKISFLIGINKKVKVVISSLVSSPVTVGYLKPIILLPVAALNNLTTLQVEAILLHELSHIRRFDYAINFIVSVIHTLLYFNPFVKSFMNVIEAERENCCDELVIQFGYDKVDYASALLYLEKTSGCHHALALAAAGKQNLLNRVEKIVGMEKKKTFKLVQIVPLFATMFCVLLFNSVLIIKDAKTGAAMSYTNDTVFTPWQLQNNHQTIPPVNTPVTNKLPAEKTFFSDVATADQVQVDVYNYTIPPAVAEPATEVVNNFIPVENDDIENSLSKEEKEKVKSAVNATKKVAGTLQWKEIEASIGDAMNDKEKAMARQEYLHELEKLSWSTIEQNMKANYDKLDWAAIEADVAKAMSAVQADSLQTVYAQALTEIEKTEKNLKAKAKCSSNPMPDASVTQLQLARETLQNNIRELKATSKPKKVVKL